MTKKKHASDRFKDENLNAVEDWDKYMLDSIGSKNSPLYQTLQKVLSEQEDFGNSLIEGYELGRTLWYSNDFFINALIMKFVEITEEETSKEIEQVFVGVRDHLDPNAAAYEIREDFDGYLITINFQMIHMITMLSELTSLLWLEKTEINPNTKATIYLGVNSIIEYIKNPNKVYNMLFQYNGMIPNPLLGERSSRMFVGGQSFVIAHEIGHHLLKHTELSNKGLVSNLAQDYKHMNNEQLDELAADNYAFELMMKDHKEYSISQLLSPLLVLIILAFNDSDPARNSLEHPSLKTRYLNLSNLIFHKDKKKAEIVQSLFNDVASLLNHRNKYWSTDWWK